MGFRSDTNYSFLDLACLEGGYSIEAALLGAKVLGIEGRQKNLDKCNFALEKLGLKNLKFKLGDVRHVSVSELGKFDVILCMGILYHLDDPVSFLETISSLCKKYIVIDTHISYEDEEKHQSVDPNLRENLSELTNLIVKEKSYNGRFYQEFPPNTSKDVKEVCLQSSLDNEKSFWATQKSLLDMLKAAGFDGVWLYLTLLRGGEWSSQSFARILIVASKSEITYSSPIWK